jgi:hypothetical protein
VHQKHTVELPPKFKNRFEHWPRSSLRFNGSGRLLGRSGVLLILLKTGETAKVMAFSENLAIHTDKGLALKASTFGRYLWMVFAIPSHVLTLVAKGDGSLELIRNKVKQNSGDCGKRNIGLKN